MDFHEPAKSATLAALRLALIGVGGIGKVHLDCLRQLREEGLVSLTAVVDPNIEALGAEKAELERLGVRWYLDYRTMLAAEQDLDAVIIATPIPFHLEMTLDCLARGLFVYLEKPPVVLIQDLETLIRADPHQRVAISFQMISSQLVQKLKAMILADEFGRVTDFRASACWPRPDSYYNRAAWAGQMSFGGKPVFDGPATNGLSHLLHNIMFLGGETHNGFTAPVQVTGEFYRVRPNIESYDTAAIKGRLRSGAEFLLLATHATEELHPFRLEVRGTSGWAQIIDDGSKLKTSSGLVFTEDASAINLHLQSYRHFVETARDRSSRHRTRLCDTRGFVLAINAALLSSGTVFSVDEQYSRVYRNAKQTGYDVPGLPALIDRSFRAGVTFSESDCSWARQTPPIETTGLQAIEFESFVRKRNF